MSKIINWYNIRH